MTIDEVRNLLSEVEYRDWYFDVLTAAGQLYLRVRFEAEDINTGEIMVQKGRKWYLSPFMTESEVVQTAFLAVKIAEEHETRESFIFRGGRPFGPHFDVAELAGLSLFSKDVRDQPIRYRFDLRGAAEAGEHEHPQRVIKRLVPDAHQLEPKPIGDCWLFSASKIDDPPAFITEVPQ